MSCQKRLAAAVTFVVIANRSCGGGDDRWLGAALVGASASSNSSSSDRLPPEEDPRERHLNRARRNQENRPEDSEPLPAPLAKQLDQAASYFANSVRVPAALVAGEAMGVIFALPTVPPNGGLPIAGALWQFHVILVGCTICAQLTTVLVCSVAHAQILDFNRDKLALEPTALDLIIRHLEFEYLTVRLAFFTGILTFLLALVARALAVLSGPAVKSDRFGGEKRLCAAFCCLLAATLCYWSHIFSQDVLIYPSVWVMVKRFFRLAWHDAHLSPWAMTSGLLGILSIGFAVSSLRRSSLRQRSFSAGRIPR